MKKIILIISILALTNCTKTICGSYSPGEMDCKKKVDWNNPGDFEFAYELGIAPDFTLDLPGKLKYTMYQPKIDDSLINKQINDLAKRYGKLISVEKAGEGDMIFANFKELDEDGNVVADGFNQSSMCFDTNNDFCARDSKF